MARVRRLLDDESGQELIEYAVLTLLFTAAGLLIASQLSGAMADSYESWDSGAQSVWSPCDPGGCP